MKLRFDIYMQTMNSNYDINDPDNNDLIVHESMDNVYSIITKQDTYHTISERKGRVLMLFNPFDKRPDVDELIDTLIEYYALPDIEMYERCAELVKLKQSDKKFSVEDIFESDIEFDPDWDIEDNDR